MIKYSVRMLYGDKYRKPREKGFVSLGEALKDFNRMVTYMRGINGFKEVIMISQITGEILLSEDSNGEHYSTIPVKNADKIEMTCERFALNMYERGMLPVYRNCTAAETIYLEALELIQAFKLK